MNKEDLLKKIREENKCSDPFEKETSAFAWKIGAMVALALSFIFYYLEWIIYGHYNVAIFSAILSMPAIKFSIEAIKIRRTFNIVCATIFSLLWIVSVIMYIIAFMNGWL